MPHYLLQHEDIGSVGHRLRYLRGKRNETLTNLVLMDTSDLKKKPPARKVDTTSNRSLAWPSHACLLPSMGRIASIAATGRGIFGMSLRGWLFFFIAVVL
jgi:hypothetical protein